MNFVKWILLIGLLLYLCFLLGLYSFQERILFLPTPLEETHVFRDGEEREVEVERGVFLNCLYLPSKGKKGLVLYLHGNRGNNRRCLNQAYQFQHRDYDLFMPDYRGYGKSDDQIVSEEQILGDIQKVFDYVKSNFHPQKILVVGYSMGSGMASFLAQNNNIDGLVLVSPFTSLTDVKDRKGVPVPDFVMKYDLNTKSRWPDINCPSYLFHSPDDQVVPYGCSIEMVESFPDKIDFMTLSNNSHRGTIFDQRLYRKVQSILDAL